MKKRIYKFIIVFTLTVSLITGCVFSASALSDDFISKNTEIDQSIYLDNTLYSLGGLDSGIKLYYNDNSYNFYDQLDENNKAAYDEIKKWTVPTTDSLTINFKDDITFTTSSIDMSNWSEEEQTRFWNTVISSLKSGLDAATFDYPEIFWLDQSQLLINIGKVQYKYSAQEKKYQIIVSSVNLTPAVKEEYTDALKANEYKNILDEAVQEFDVSGSDRYEKLKYIHDVIGASVTYNIDGTYCDTALGAFIEPYEVVCEGYAKAFKIICDKESIPCVFIVGNLNLETNTAHAWNYVQMEDGNWYAVDLTWDDLDLSSVPVKYSYFLKGSDSFFKNHVQDDGQIAALKYPELAESDYAYNPVVTTVNTSTTEITSVTTSTTLITTSVTTKSSESDIKTGDFNNDGKVTVTDLVLLKKIIIKAEPLSNISLESDMNGDDIINIYDVMLLARFLLKGV